MTVVEDALADEVALEGWLFAAAIKGCLCCSHIREHKRTDGIACTKTHSHAQTHALVHPQTSPSLHRRQAEKKLCGEDGNTCQRRNTETVMLRGLKMLCPVWMLAMAALCVLAVEVSSQCWESPRCRYLNSEENRLECIRMCRSDLTAETPVFPGEGHLQPPEPETSEESNSLPALPLSPALAPQDTSELKQPSPRQEEKRTYAMEHFRWGKPVGRKRRPIKVFTNGVEEESAEELPAEMRREALDGTDSGTEKEEQATLAGLLAQQKKDAPYVIKHFRWSAPPASKRYGGFMKSWDERSQKPLLTLFKNVINKDGQQKKDQ
ncbi:hypothetical protein ACEWY4_005186 [Coilia grayii]|uniref:Met-enkephalin n=1 Tax=Coilia grayii TaxID=363190 RepID=A0ABD1KI82_9TELE